MRSSTGSVSSPVFIIGIPMMVIIADLVTRGVHNSLWHLAAMVVVALLLSWPLRLAMGAYDRRLECKMQAEATPREYGARRRRGTGQPARFQTNEPWCWKQDGGCSYGEVMERPLNPATAPTFLIGVAVIVIVGRLVTAGIENFWWRLLAMTLIGLVLSWPLRFVMQASDRRFGREMQEDVTRRE